jgi:hypothetical protein
MHPETKAQRERFVLQINDEIITARGTRLEEVLKESGYVLTKLYANIPFNLLQDCYSEYVEKVKKKEIKSAFIIPAWWLPSAMERIVEKELLPFAIYVKQ